MPEQTNEVLALLELEKWCKENAHFLVSLNLEIKLRAVERARLSDRMEKWQQEVLDQH